MNNMIELGKYDALNVNLSEYSYTETDVNHYLTESFDVDFNKEIIINLTGKTMQT